MKHKVPMAIQINSYSFFLSLLQGMHSYGLPAFIRAGDGIPDKGDLIVPVLDCEQFLVLPTDIKMVSVRTAEAYRERYGDIRLYIEVEKLHDDSPFDMLLNSPGFKTLPYVIEWLTILEISCASSSRESSPSF